MSLVSYADSDDSSGNDSGTSEPEKPSGTVETETESSRPDTSLKEERLLTSARKDNKREEKDDDNPGEAAKPKSIGNLFSSLPAPWMSSLSWASKGKGGLTGKTAKGDKKQQTVKIALPVVEESDSDEEAPRGDERKPFHGSQKPSGLTSFLPKPKHSVVVKENNPNRPVVKMSNRPLIPDSLRRKQVKQVERPKKESGKKKVKTHDSDEDEDEDEASVDFFSFGEQEAPSAVKNVTSSDSQGSTMVTELVTSEPGGTRHYDSLSSNNNVAVATTVTPSSAKDTGANVSGLSQPSYCDTGPSLYQGEQFVTTQPSYDNPYGLGQSTENQVTASSGGLTTGNQDYSYATSEPYYEYNYGTEPQATQQAQYTVEYSSHVQPADQDFSQQWGNLRGKRARGEENINIVDVNVDDQVGSSSDWRARYQREDADYKPQSKKKENLPSSQQKRKHQITYLAFQAKESEMKLRNQWAANSQTRRQTQSKYGF